MKKMMLAMVLAVLPCAAVQAAGALAKVEQGELRGTMENGLAVYRGVPFAAPPVGALRWRAPQPAARWSGTRAAEKFAPQCMQGAGGPPRRTGAGHERGLPVPERVDPG